MSGDSATTGFTGGVIYESDAVNYLGFTELFFSKLKQFDLIFQNSRIICVMCGARGWKTLLKHCEDRKMLNLENLNFTTDQKKKVEDELELAHLKMRKMVESFKNIEDI
jgi:hypothetical protein